MNISTEFYFSTLDELPIVAKWVLNQLGDKTIATFKGELGAGKTTLIKEICQLLGVTDIVQSPTFSIVNQYPAANGSIYHIDAYRIESIEEALDIGMEDYLYSDDYCFVEWPSKIERLLNESVNFEILNNDGQRIIKVI